MDRRYIRALFLLVLVAVLAACQRAKPQHVAIQGPELPGGSSLQFELAQAPAQAVERVEGPSFVVKQDNCSGAAPMETIHRETIALGPAYELGKVDGALDLAPYRAVIEEIVLRRYGADEATSVDGEVALRTAAQAKSEFVLRWDDSWDRNILNIIQEGRVIGTVPLKVRLGTQLVLVSSREELCVAPTTGTPGKALLPIVGVPVTTTTTASPDATASLAALPQGSGTPSAMAASPETPTGMERPTRIPRPNSTLEPTLMATPSATATSAHTPTRTLRPTRTVRPTRTMRPSFTPRPTRTSRPTRTPTASRTSVPTLVPLVVPSATAQPTPTETVELSATEEGAAEPGSQEAIDLVRDYLQFLQARQFRDAYNLLDETYQQRMSYESFARGYDGVLEIELYGIESDLIDEQHESVRAAMRIRTVTGSADWMGTYEVVQAPGKLPYERRISSTGLSRLPAGEPVG